MEHVINARNAAAWIASKPSRAARAWIALESTWNGAGSIIRAWGYYPRVAGIAVRRAARRAGEVIREIGVGYSLMLRDRNPADVAALLASAILVGLLVACTGWTP